MSEERHLYTEDQSPVVPTRQGIVRGLLEGQVEVYKGIPFAAPPVGALRWSPPRPPAGWQGIRDATRFGPAPIQTPLDPLLAKMPQSEDCLSLNIWTPQERLATGRPVMVWIYGGGFTTGSGCQYDGSAFARDGIVLVTFNYRLGRLGFFAHPALLDDAGLGVNFGMMDQIAALQWVNENIASFGGDPGNVTIFGESAGGMSVNQLMTCSQSHGLFHKAISQSGFPRAPLRSLNAAQSHAVKFAQELGIYDEPEEQLNKLRSVAAVDLMPVEDFLDWARPVPIIDGKLIVKPVADSFAAGEQVKIPYLAGGNSNEASIVPGLCDNPEAVLHALGPLRDRVVQLFDGADCGNPITRLFTAMTTTEPVRYVASQIQKSGAAAYLYQFAYVPGDDRQATCGADHGAEIPYVFDMISSSTLQNCQAGEPASSICHMVAKTIHSYWVAFAKFGCPRVEGQPEWPEFNHHSSAYMGFHEDGRVFAVREFQSAALDFIFHEKPEPCVIEFNYTVVYSAGSQNDRLGK